MSEEQPAPAVGIMGPQRFGRTWADFTISAGHIVVIVGLLAVAYFLGALDTAGEILGSIPLWVFVSAVLTLAWLPWLVRISEDATRLVLVAHGGRKVSEWRIGRRVPLKIDGEALTVSSASGAPRIIVTSFDPDTLEAEGTALEGATVFDLARDLEAFDRLGRAFTEHLRSDRLTREMVGVEVERRVGELSDSWLRLLFGSLDPTKEVVEAMTQAGANFDQATLDGLLDTLEGEQ